MFCRLFCDFPPLYSILSCSSPRPSIHLYNATPPPISTSLCSRLSAFDMQAQRTITYTKWFDYKENIEVRSLTKRQLKPRYIAQGRLRWFGYLVRSPLDHPAPAIYTFIPKAGMDKNPWSPSHTMGRRPRQRSQTAGDNIYGGFQHRPWPYSLEVNHCCSCPLYAPMPRVLVKWSEASSDVLSSFHSPDSNSSSLVGIIHSFPQHVWTAKWLFTNLVRYVCIQSSSFPSPIFLRSIIFILAFFFAQLCGLLFLVSTSIQHFFYFLCYMPVGWWSHSSHLWSEDLSGSLQKCIIWAEEIDGRLSEHGSVCLTRQFTRAIDRTWPGLIPPLFDRSLFHSTETSVRVSFRDSFRVFSHINNC